MSRLALRSSSSAIFMKVFCYHTGLTTENKQDRDNRTSTATTDIIEALCTSRIVVPSQSASLIKTSKTFFRVVLARPTSKKQKYCRQKMDIGNMYSVFPKEDCWALGGITLHKSCHLNTFASSYLNSQELNNSCLKSPASTLVDLTFNRARSALSA